VDEYHLINRRFPHNAAKIPDRVGLGCVTNPDYLPLEAKSLRFGREPRETLEDLFSGEEGAKNGQLDVVRLATRLIMEATL
jgi:hypothetical protein